jgi:uncharacterized protein with HEPN domain
MAKDPSIRIGHMLDAIGGIRATIGGDPFSEVFGNWTRRMAVERGFEIVSEASRHLPRDLKAAEPEIPWQDIAGIGNILRHDYDGVRMSIIYQASLKGLPALEAALRRMLDRLSDHPET